MDALAPATLTKRALNRATLERQLLTRRHAMPTVDVVEHLVGLQAQTPHTWYVGLWNRVEGFTPEQAADALLDRRLVRIALMRSTIHLVSARDCLRLRPLVQRVIERSTMGNFGKRLAAVERSELESAARKLLDEQPLSFADLGRALGERWPDVEPAALSQGARAWLPLVQVPPRGVWGRSGPIAHATAESWLDAPLAPEPSIDDMVLRYLGAFGPASVADVQTWSGLTRLREVVDRLRPRLAVFRDENGKELFDLPDAPRPDEDVEVPARLLYDYDNLLLSHHDRGRVISESYFAQNFAMDGPMPRVILVDGFTNGTWLYDRVKRTSTVTLRPFTRWSARDTEAVTAEAARLLEFLAPRDTHEVRLLTP